MIQNINRWRFSDYTLDDARQGYGFARETWKGRGISFLDISSQLCKAVAGTVASVGIAVILLLPGTFYGMKSVGSGTLLVGCYLVRASASTKTEWRKSVGTSLTRSVMLLSGALFTVTIGIPASLLWRILMISANTLGMVAPEIGRKGRNLGKILSPALEMIKKLPPNPSNCLIKVSSARPVYHHSFIPLAIHFTEAIVSKPFNHLIWKIYGGAASDFPSGSSLRQTLKASYAVYSRYGTPFSSTDEKTKIHILLLNHLH